MRVAAVELFVSCRRPRRTGPPLGDPEVIRALRKDPRGRNALALEAIEAAAALEADVVLCPGWTFVGRAPRDAALARASAGRTVVYEVLPGEPEAGSAEGARGGGLPPRSYAFEGGASRPLAPQVIAVSAELDAAAAVALAAALGGERRAGPGVVLAAGEINAVRRETVGGRVAHRWDERVAAAGVPAASLAGALVLNPAHLPAGSYLRDKRRAGPWRALVATANRLDPKALVPPRAPPAHAVVAGKDLAPAAPPVALDDRGSRVVLFDVGA